MPPRRRKFRVRLLYVGLSMISSAHPCRFCGERVLASPSYPRPRRTPSHTRGTSYPPARSTSRSCRVRRARGGGKNKNLSWDVNASAFSRSGKRLLAARTRDSSRRVCPLLPRPAASRAFVSRAERSQSSSIAITRAGAPSASKIGTGSAASRKIFPSGSAFRPRRFSIIRAPAPSSIL